jgi:methylthioribulose-1-phosphate dehydratase
MLVPPSNTKVIRAAFDREAFDTVLSELLGTLTAVSDQRELLCEMLRLFHSHGWASGTGGGICAIESPGRVLLAPTGVHKELVRPEDLFVIDVASGEVLEAPAHGLKPSECKDVFRTVIAKRGAGAVVHSHALSAVLACDLAPDDALRISGLEMLKGIPGVANTDEHCVPVIANTPTEPQIVQSVERALDDDRFAGAYAIGVRDHGAYLWGADIWEAKKHAEVYHFLFEAVRARRG